MQNSILDMIKGRRSVRNWLVKPVGDEKINKLIEAAKWAPSSCNRQTWKFLIVKGKKSLDFLSSIVPGSVGFSNLAPINIIILIDIRLYNLPKERHTAYIDGALAVQNMFLMATELGLSGSWIDLDFMTEESECIMRNYFEIPDYMLIVTFIPLGYASKYFSIPARRENDEIIIWDKF